ncbi:hypothetical protein C5610_05435 [Idiomarina sp. OT37-5b]|uniref:Uncharacterized protein n=1 Tax=Idiomarina aquatica TaxID=1327752 RepID=A0AA94JDZ4_9GAMM|nr:hypothetical protein C5610_05435 [Idiomarina sp. OT37-5b]RUO44580.1 hypothetical protein CWE23_00650 [Idiomarina aquatica]
MFTLFKKPLFDIVGWRQQPALAEVDGATARRAIAIAKLRAKIYFKGSVLLRQSALLAVIFAAIVLPEWGSVPAPLLIIPAYLFASKALNASAYRQYAFPLLPQAVDDALKFPLKGA